jgi:hypothetical protein
MIDYENMHANAIKSYSQKYIFKNKQHLARKKLQLEMKSLMILGMSLLVDPPTDKVVQKSSYFGHTKSAGRAIAAAENAAFGVGKSPMIVVS